MRNSTRCSGIPRTVTLHAAGSLATGRSRVGFLRARISTKIYFRSMIPQPSYGDKRWMNVAHLGAGGFSEVDSPVMTEGGRDIRCRSAYMTRRGQTDFHPTNTRPDCTPALSSIISEWLSSPGGRSQLLGESGSATRYLIKSGQLRTR